MPENHFKILEADLNVRKFYVTNVPSVFKKMKF